MNGLATELQTANLLIEKGVKVEIPTPFFYRLFGRKKIELIIKAPSTELFIKIAIAYLEMKIDVEKEMTLRDAFGLFALHAEKMSEIIALCASNTKNRAFVAKQLRKTLTQREMSYLFFLIITQGGIEDFISTIKLMQVTRITKPMNLSPAEKMS